MIGNTSLNIYFEYETFLNGNYGPNTSLKIESVKQSYFFIHSFLDWIWPL